MTSHARPAAPFAAAVGGAVRALIAPWSIGSDADALSSRGAIVIAAVNTIGAALLSTVLSTWTYLVGKGLLMTVREMDMGMDDLPSDSVAQVGLSFVASVAIWTALLALALGIAAVVADGLYHCDRFAFRRAMRRTSLLTVWFVVWAVAILAANSVRQREIRHPAAAVRAYAQLNQHWFRGSSATDPGPLEREPLVARGRLRALVAIFPVLWALALPPRGTRPAARIGLVLAAVVGSWILWAAAWRLLPWTVLETFAG